MKWISVFIIATNGQNLGASNKCVDPNFMRDLVGRDDSYLAADGTLKFLKTSFFDKKGVKFLLGQGLFQSGLSGTCTRMLYERETGKSRESGRFEPACATSGIGESRILMFSVSSTW